MTHEDDSGDDDEYYTRMEEHGRSYGAMETEQLDETREYTVVNDHVDDNTYYERLNDLGAKSIFLSEEKLIWQSLLRQQVERNASGYFTLIGKRDESSLQLIHQWLFSYLPKSSALFGKITTYMSSELDDMTIYCDDPVHSRIAFCYRFVDGTMEIYLHLDDYVTDITLFHFGELIRNINPDKLGIEMAGVDQNALEFVKNALRRVGFVSSWIVVCDLLVCEKSLEYFEKICIEHNLPDEYEYVELQPSHASQLVREWPYATESSLDMVSSLMIDYR